jgi:hypothetical protein
MKCIWFKSLDCGAHGHYQTRTAFSATLRWSLLETAALRCTRKLLLHSGTHTLLEPRTLVATKSKQKQKQREGKYFTPMPNLFTKKWKGNTIFFEIQLYAYLQKGLEIISLVTSVRLLAVRLEKRRSQMFEFVLNFVFGMFTKSCLCIPILYKIDQKYCELHAKGYMRL